MIDTIAIRNTDFRVKVVAMLQQNWALIEGGDTGAVRIYFVSDEGGVFDEIVFPSTAAARASLRRNGFQQFAKSSDLQSFLCAPAAPFHRAAHPNGPIYSSGRFWRS